MLSMDLDAMTLSSDSLNMFKYEDRRTEFGLLEATRATSGNNARHSRFIVNSEVEGCEYFRYIKGSDLAPGAAETLEDQKVVEFDLKQRKKELKEHPLEKVGPCC